MAETREGGVYKVGDEWQDANGEKTAAPKVEKEEPEGPGRPKGS